MGKSLFTIIFLIIALMVTLKVKSFINNNKPITIPDEPVYLELPEDNPQEYIFDATTTIDSTLEI